MPYDSPLLRGHTLGSDEGRIQQNELMDLVIKLSDRCEPLETDLRQTKKVYGDAFTRLIKKVSDQGEVHTQQDQPEAHLRVLSEAKVLANVARKRRNQFSTAGMVQEASTPSLVVTKDKGKAVMQESESPKKMKQREQIQISRDKEVALKLQEEFDVAERQRMAQKMFCCSTKRAEAKRNKPMTLLKQKDYMSHTTSKNPEGSGEEHSAEKEKELSQEDLQQILDMVVPVGRKSLLKPTAKSCLLNAQYCHCCALQSQFIYPEPDYSLDFNSPQNSQSFQQQYLCCDYCGGPHETFQCQPMNEDYYHEQNPCYDSNSFGFDQFQPPQYTVYHQILNSQNEFFNSQNEQFNSGFEHLNTQMTTLHDLIAQAMQKKEEEKRIAEEQAAKERYWKIPICDDDDDNDYTIAITPVLSTEEPVNSLIMENEHLDTISATESDEFIKSSVEILVPIPSESKGVPKVCDVPFHDNSPPLDISKDQSEDFSDSNVDSTSTDEDSFSSNDVEYVEASPPNSEPVSSKVMEIVIPEVGRIEDDILLIKDDTLREKLLNVNRLVAKIEALKDNPVPSSVVVTKSTSTFPNLFLEETNTFDNSLPESETFCFNLEEPSSGSTTTHVDFSQYDSFIFDLSNDQFPPADRSDFYHEEFADELAQIISQPEYDCFFKIEPELGNLTMDVVGNIFQTKEPRVHVLNVLPTLELDFIPSSESIFAYVVWIFLPFLFIPVIPPYLLSCGDEDTIFDPGISKVSFF
ncbi:hypothetical protein Tco_1254954 [Tanacetum coccineum]